MTKVICFASGKGGVGKTTISSNLAYEISKSNKNVLLFDADLGLANAQIALGIKPKFSFNDFLSGEKSLNDILVKPFDVKEGAVLMYYPEVNSLISQNVDPLSNTPGFKSMIVSIGKSYY